MKYNIFYKYTRNVSVSYKKKQRCLKIVCNVNDMYFNVVYNQINNNTLKNQNVPSHLLQISNKDEFAMTLMRRLTASTPEIFCRVFDIF